MPTRLITALVLFAALLPAQRDWNDPFPPHRIADNLYYVGSKGLSTYLITTDQGHILINSSFERTVPIIRANVEALGFQFTDIKILLGSHAHSDHMEGNALVRKLTGAQVYVMEGDDQVIANGGAGQYLYDAQWPACPIDRVLKDGDKVTLGKATLTARRTPGHTRGCTTWTMQATDAGKTYNVVIIGSPNVNEGYQLVNNDDYPEIAKDFATTFQVLKSLPCDIFLGAHGSYYGMEEKVKRLKPGTNPFVDPEGCRAYIEEREQYYRDTLAKHKQTKLKAIVAQSLSLQRRASARRKTNPQAKARKVRIRPRTTAPADPPPHRRKTLRESLLNPARRCESHHPVSSTKNYPTEIMEPDLNQQRRRAHDLLDRLSPEKLTAARSLPEVIVEPLSDSLAAAPVEDQEIAPETAAVIDRARTSLARGAAIPTKKSSASLA